MKNKDLKQTQIRKCIVTGEHLRKNEMIRIVSFQGGPISLDLSGKAAGRGCYVSLQDGILEKLIDRNGAVMARAFKRGISKEEIEYLKIEFPKVLEEKKFRPKATKNVVLRISRKEYLDTKSKSKS
jgi:uncharacterized protein